MRGSEQDAQANFFDSERMLPGSRFFLRADPPASVRFAVDYLVAQGFVERSDNLLERLAAQGSEWIALAVEIGDTTKSRKAGFVADLVEDTWLAFLPQFRRVISPTIVMISARWCPDGTTELVTFPHASTKGDPSTSRAGGPRLRAAFDAMKQAATQSGLLVSATTMTHIANDGCPSSQKAVRELLGWK